MGVAGLALLAPLLALATPAEAAPADATRVGVLDLRPEGAPEQARSDLAAALETRPELDVASDPELRAALLGMSYQPERARGLELAAEARSAATTGDCAAAMPLAESAATALSAARAGGAPAEPELIAVYALWLRCADALGDTDEAQMSVARLRALEVGDPPPGIDAELWQRYPEVDAATNVHFAQTTIVSDPPGALVWIDHRRVGTAPLTTAVRQGRRLVVVARGNEGRARVAELTGWTAALSFELEPSPRRWQPIADRVAGWRHRGGEIGSPALSELMSAVEMRALVSIDRDGRFTAWILPARARRARSLGTTDSAAEAAALLASAETSPQLTAAPLLTETPEERARYYGRPGGLGDDDDDEGQEWWVYAGLAGAIGVAAAVILAHDLGSDRQRIEVTLP